MDKRELDIILKEGEGYKIEFKEGLGNLDKGTTGAPIESAPVKRKVRSYREKRKSGIKQLFGEGYLYFMVEYA